MITHEILKQYGLNAVKKYRVRSKSGPGYHVVEIKGDGSMVCDCVAGSMGRPCRHVRILNNYFNNRFYEPSYRQNISKSEEH